MKMLTIKQELVEGLDSDKSKIEFADTVKLMFENPKLTTSGITYQTLRKRLNTNNFPRLHLGVVPIGTRGMSAATLMRYEFSKVGYVPVSFDCSYDDYEYEFLCDMTDSQVISFLVVVNKEKTNIKGRRGYMKYLRYLHLVCFAYCIEEDRENCLVRGC